MLNELLLYKDILLSLFIFSICIMFLVFNINNKWIKCILFQIYDFTNTILNTKYQIVFFVCCIAILISNILGVFGLFAIFGSIFNAAYLSIIMFTIACIEGWRKHKYHIIISLSPSNIPIVLKPLIIILELISFIMRSLMISIRLCMGITIAHFILNVTIGILNKFYPYGYFGLPILIIIQLVDIGKAGLQTFLFLLFSKQVTTKLSEDH